MTHPSITLENVTNIAACIEELKLETTSEMETLSGDDEEATRNGYSTVFPDVLYPDADDDKDEFCTTIFRHHIESQNHSRIIINGYKIENFYHAYSEDIPVVVNQINIQMEDSEGRVANFCRNDIIELFKSQHIKYFTLMDLDLRKMTDFSYLSLFLYRLHPAKEHYVRICISEYSHCLIYAFCAWLSAQGKHVVRFEIQLNCELRIMRDFVPFLLRYMPNLEYFKIYRPYGNESKSTTNGPVLVDKGFRNLCPKLVCIEVANNYLLNATVLRWISYLECSHLERIGDCIPGNRKSDTEVVQFYWKHFQLILNRSHPDGYMEIESCHSKKSKRLLQSYTKFGFFSQGLKFACNKK